MFLHQLTGKNTHWVFGPVFKKFERENLENNTLYSSNFDFIVSKSQIFVELCTASGNSKKRSNRPTRSGTELFVYLNCKITKNLAIFVEKTLNLA